MMRRSVLLSSVGVLFVMSLGACTTDGGVAGPPRGEPFVFGGSTATLDTAVVGTWIRSVTSVDETGVVRTTETIWAFNADRSAVRTTITRDATGGVVNQQDAFARWEIQGAQLVIDFFAPFTQRVTLPYSRSGGELTLGGLTFGRLL